LAAKIAKRRKTGGAEGDANGPKPPRAPETVIDDDGNVFAEPRPKTFVQKPRRPIGIFRQKQDRFRPAPRVDIRLVDPGIGEHEAQPVFDNKHAGFMPQHLAGFAEDHLNQPRIFLHLLGQRQRAFAGFDCREIDVSAFGLRDDLLGEHQDVAVA